MRLRRLPLVALLALAGCGGPGGPNVNRNASCSLPWGGILSLTWSIGGAAATASSCARIDHLTVKLASTAQLACAESISPVPCALDRWRYDQLPEGPTHVTLSGVDARGLEIASGSADVNLATSAPPIPAGVMVTFSN